MSALGKANVAPEVAALEALAPAIDLAERRMEFHLLGPLEVLHRGDAVDARGKKGALLARLLLDAGRTVSIDALVDALWDGDVPRTAVKMVHVYVSQLRKALPPGILRTRAPGYLLDVAPEAVDVLRFERMRGEARAALGREDLAEAGALFRAALALWRGPALAEFAEPFAVGEAARLEELRLATLEERIEADLALGRHADVIGELQALVAAHPLRHRLRCQLLLALYRAGRHAEALAGYQDFRRTLCEELGIEPPAALRDLQRRILNQDPGLDLVVAGPLDGPPAVPAAHGRSQPNGLVGRAQELGRLEAALETAAAGRGATAFVAGAAGIGKTLLARELTDRALRRGATVLSGRCIDVVGAAVPYLPLVEALRPLAGSSVVTGLPELSRLLPGGGARPGSEPSRDQGADASRLHLFEEVLAVLERLAAQAPVVLLVEDLHWADGSTLDLLAFLARAVAQRPVLVLLTWRRQGSRPDDPVQRLAAGLQGAGHAELVELGPLAEADLRSILARGGDAAVSDELAAAVCARSEGNPFYAQELLAAALRGEHELPRLLRDVLLLDVSRLTPGSRPVVRVASAAGRDVHHRVLTAAAGLAEREVIDALRDAVDVGVLVPETTSGTYRFRHALIAEAIYTTLLPGEREQVHERLAVALSQEPERAPGTSAAAELASHWIAAARPVEAMAASLRAARDAQAVSGLGEALHHLEQVLELWDQVPRAEEVAGLAMPAVLAWAAELAGVGPPPQGAPRTITVSEARALYPLALVLESIAIRQTPSFDPHVLEALRAANERLRAARRDPAAAVAADDEFHRLLSAQCGNEPLLAALRPVKRALFRYEHEYMSDGDRIDRSVSQHEGIVASLERGDQHGAAQRLRRNITSGLPDLTEALER